MLLAGEMAGHTGCVCGVCRLAVTLVWWYIKNIGSDCRNKRAVLGDETVKLHTFAATATDVGDCDDYIDYDHDDFNDNDNDRDRDYDHDIKK